jgi:hypothetical protein
MNTHIRYAEIPKEERKQLEAEAYRQSPKLRTVRFAALLLPVALSIAPTDHFTPPDSSLFVHLVIRVACALVLSAMIWETIGRPKLKAEVEKLKNA